VPRKKTAWSLKGDTRLLWGEDNWKQGREETVEIPQGSTREYPVCENLCFSESKGLMVKGALSVARKVPEVGGYG